MVCDCAKIACIYFEFFWRPKKSICCARKEILKEGKSAIFYLKQLGFSNWRLWQEDIGHLRDDVILLLRPESFRNLLSCAN